ncbi:MAG: FAD-dependent oxidoreductase [Solirubrobacterales bacterium]
MTAKSFDTIVIGGGPGGAVTGAILAARGQETLLVESTDRVGGRARTYAGAEFGSAAELTAEWERQGARVIAHENIDGGALDGYAFELGEHGIAGSHLLRTPYVAGICGAEIEILPNVGAFWDHEGELFPIVRGERFEWMSDEEFADVKTISRAMMQLSDEEVDALDDIGFRSWMSSVTDAPVATAFHGSMATMNTGPCNPEDISTGAHLRINRQIIRAGAHIAWAGIGFPVPGYGAIPEGFHRAFEKLGGTTRLSSPVEEVLIEEGRAAGIRVGGEEIRSQRVVCAMPVPLLPKILAVNEAMRSDLDRYRGFRSGAALTHYIGCAEPVVEDDGAWHTSPHIAPASDGYSGDLVSGWIASSNCVAERAPDGKQLFESWCGMTTEEAGDPALVENARRRQWAKLTELHPELEEYREWTLVTLAPRAYPVFPCPGQVNRSLAPVEPGWYEGLYLVGDSVRSWGCSIDQVMHSALLACSAILDEDLLQALPDYQR